jgi:hypothetical protein
MGSDTVVIFGIRFEYPAQMRLAQDNDVVHTLTPDRSDQRHAKPASIRVSPPISATRGRITFSHSSLISFKRLEAENSWDKSDISAPGA